MHEKNKGLFVGIKISAKLQRELDNCARGTEHYFKEDKPESLQIVTIGEDKMIGRFLQDGFAVAGLDDVSRNVRSIVSLITSGYRLTEDAVRIYAGSGDGAAVPVS
ncbi:MAG TPA: hypothetical protein VGL11_10910 [Candidatus Binatia bacterium]|jgi:hypothetical protein